MSNNTNNYNRYIKNYIEQALSNKKAVLIYGPRQVGKTTIVKSFIRNNKDVFFNCDDIDILKLFVPSSSKLKNIVDGYNRIIIDEAQRIPDAGIVLKLLIDTYKEKEFIITGSSSLELSYGTFDALTGRVKILSMFPLSISELIESGKINKFSNIESEILYGTYPEVVNQKTDNYKESTIVDIAKQYLFKDTLSFESQKDSVFLEKLLALLASFTGSTIAVNNLANLLMVGRNTVDRYLTLFEQLFIIIPLRPYYNNPKNRILNQSKYYFLDTGVRNSVSKNFGSLDTRLDKGGLWENFIIIERMKRNQKHNHNPQYFFYRGKNGAEIDLIESKNGKLTCFEIKYKENSISKAVRNMSTEELGVKVEDIRVINSENFLDYIT